MPIDPVEDPPLQPGRPSEPSPESPPGNPRPEVLRSTSERVVNIGASEARVIGNKSKFPFEGRHNPA